MTKDREKKPFGFPKRAALVAAALAAALCVTAAAAEIPAVQEFFATVFVTVSAKDDVITSLTIPTVAVEKREERTILIVDGEETDVTDALAKEGKYLHQGEGFEVAVDETGRATVTAYGADDTVVTYTVGGEAGSGVVYKVIGEDENGQPAIFRASEAGDAEAVRYGAYNVVVDPSGATDVAPAGE